MAATPCPRRSPRSLRCQRSLRVSICPPRCPGRSPGGARAAPEGSTVRHPPEAVLQSGFTRDGHVKHKYFPANVSGKVVREMRVEGGRGTPDPWGTKVPWPCAWSRGRGTRTRLPGGNRDSPFHPLLPPCGKVPVQDHVNKVIFLLKKNTLGKNKKPNPKQTTYTARPQCKSHW